ncbi:MAG: phosphate signaling complex protein PhoU [Armatimonadetes bacterium]|nr:phosphate signaling complex protein PhoU [Armatimonadota bacterium]
MAKHFQREIDQTKKRVLSLSAMVEEALRKAVGAVARRDFALAEEVITADAVIDQAEVELEEECLKILALHQPVAIDLRFVVVVLKINDELERIGDLSANIASRGLELRGSAPVACPFDYEGMSERAQWMLGRGIDALVNLDSDLARQVWFKDDEVDEIHRGMYGAVKARIRSHPDELEAMIVYLGISRILERIADHAKSIAKDVIYMVEGEIVRHRGRELRALAADQGKGV